MQIAYVLHARPYRETSALLELLTAERGRVGAVARGARRARRGVSSAPQSFMTLQVELRGRGELQTLAGFEVDTPRRLAGDALYAGLYLNELLVRLLERDDAQPGVFDAYGDAVEALARGDDLEPVLRRFEFALLGELGYGFALDADADGRPLDAQRHYRVIVDAGLVPEDDRPGDGVADADDGLAFPGATLLALADGDLASPATRRAAKRIARAALAPHLGARPLRSRALFTSRRAV